MCIRRRVIDNCIYTAMWVIDTPIGVVVPDNLMDWSRDVSSACREGYCCDLEELLADIFVDSLRRVTSDDSDFHCQGLNYDLLYELY